MEKTSIRNLEYSIVFLEEIQKRPSFYSWTVNDMAERTRLLNQDHEWKLKIIEQLLDGELFAPEHGLTEQGSHELVGMKENLPRMIRADLDRKIATRRKVEAYTPENTPTHQSEAA